ncbi:hypothetical protein D3C72_1544060 [compost metagenome]
MRIELPAPVRGVLRVRGEQAAVELTAQLDLAGKRGTGRRAQDEAVGQLAIARQEIDVFQLQFGRLAQFVLPAQRGAADPQFALRRQPAQSGMIQVGLVIAGIQVDFLSGHPQVVGRIPAQHQFRLFELQAHQRGRQSQYAAPCEHGGYGWQRQHWTSLVVVDLDGGKIEPGIQPLPVGADRADRNSGAQRLAGVGFNLRAPLVHTREDPVAHAQKPDGNDAIYGQRSPEQAAEHFF